jgi:uncharacterized protein (DUF58 family)
MSSSVSERKYLDPFTVSKLKHIEVKARLIVEGFITGLHRSPYHGFSVEFAEHRPYNPGEPLRNLDWKVYGKTNKLFTKKYEEETNLRCSVVLDVSDSMRYPTDGPISKLEYGAYLAAALGFLMQKQRDAVGLSLFDSDLKLYMPPKARESWLMEILLRLEEVSRNTTYFQHKTATPEVLHKLAQKLGRRGLLVIITDLLGNPAYEQKLYPALQHLRHANHEVLIFQLLERKTEANFDFPNRPLTLQDLETGEELKVHAEQVRAAYREAMSAYQSRLLRRTRELKVDVVEVDIATPYDKLLLDYLIKRRHLTK